MSRREPQVATVARRRWAGPESLFPLEQRTQQDARLPESQGWQLLPRDAGQVWNACLLWKIAHAHDARLTESRKRQLLPGDVEDQSEIIEYRVKDARFT
ncbi:hypothetical protein NDU88_003793 [Pleurodeles waltl]|uniref:Uncharacterized protein n=1 Tax=Pleurodeles waltl TaxID=8319 RepID=A0AAV7V2I7_PLEWA|nr:hypothetical protein NDU88_003793 [Pleurodeles waltl]